MMSVSSLNTKIKSLLEATFMHTLVEGEVASVTYHTSGHLYFSIKDDKSSIKCVMWRSSVARMKFRIEKGMHIVVEGSISVYTPRGEYQFQTVRIEPYGQGALALAYEQLKKRLKEKGYFSSEHKKILPKHIQKIALVTAKESAALYDMLKIIEKRWAMIEVTIVDTLVQGEQAASQIAHALRYADTLNVDVVVVGRGGGSAEDLWSFNEEIVADAIFHLYTPVVSAVGHEVDVMISDFVADLRAPTPSAAMEMILPDSREILYTLNEINERYKYSLEQNFQKKIHALNHLEELLLRSSPFLRLVVIDDKFGAQKNEFRRILEYKIEYISSKIPEVNSVYQERMRLKIQDKERHLALLNEKFKLGNPKLKCHEGWAQISYMGKKVSLEMLEIDKPFILEDESMRVEALCLSKKKS
ncbi:MAG TPA: exodeoxyribonuclease VII large subunit [Epsilonproteobacteria bacterium]|nr:exodeoxyribonuclease VII large subunit [Campylobacterota bacterium]